MDSPTIITKADFEGRIDISSNLNEQKKLNQHIRHAMDFDLRDLMSDRFYYYFISFFNEDGVLQIDAPQSVRDLFNGVVYQVDTINYTNPGVKPVLVYFTGARLIKGIDATITPNGYRDKVNEFSEQVGAARKSFQANEYENQALAYWRQVQTYLESNKILYPQYFGDNCGCGVERSTGRAKRVSVGGRKFYGETVALRKQVGPADVPVDKNNLFNADGTINDAGIIVDTQFYNLT